ncbi:hypothetical protein LMOh7858_pLM80_0019 [Listeria monocytogenes str. 4b H7858]|nr:hypothetical protein LMOh7858_pLM80_0019 [Listeria monocytogenes str. 4b H7858] [Listeria monocytogenes serotype 4b str. H7858]CBV37250.1 hypothetical protein LGRDSM20601_p0025 [Listeria grayi]
MVFLLGLVVSPAIHKILYQRKTEPTLKEEGT